MNTIFTGRQPQKNDGTKPKCLEVPNEDTSNGRPIFTELFLFLSSTIKVGLWLRPQSSLASLD